MRKFSSRFVLAAALALGAGLPLLTPVATPTVQAAAQDQVVLVEQLKTDAFKALRDGKFNVVNDLLTRAASVSKDPAVERMASWTKQFETQRADFAAERRKQYEKSVEQVRLLEKEGYKDYAIDAAKDAYLLAEDKSAFRQEKWVDDLVNWTIAQAEQYEKNEEWLKALRLYSDLSAVEPSNPHWKDRLKTATRRIRLLALYAPDELKAVQKSESKTREAVEKLIRPATQPADASTKPADALAEGDDEQSADDFKIDWRDSLRGIQMPMLFNALIDARINYWRDVSYRDLMIGGLKGMQAIATTRGLDKAFPGLADSAKRDRFLAVVNDGLEAAKNSTAADDQFVLNTLLGKLTAVNKETVAIPEEVIVSEFADGAFGELDPFSSMIWPSDLEEFNKTTQGEFSGVGIQIQSDPDGSLRVVTPIEDTPAYKAGIRAEDIVTKINGKSAKGISLTQAVKIIQGPQGTYVALTIKTPSGEVKELNLKRDTIKVSSIKGWNHRPGGGWDYLIDPDNKIAYIRCTNFTKATSDDLDRAIREIERNGGRGIILDLRYNPGGLLTAATEVTDKFLDKGVIVSTHADRDTPQQPTVATAKNDDADEVRMPVIVLVNQYSASASEIVSGALKDQKRAIVVGERTFGKGSVQMLFPLSSRSAYLKLTTSHYYLPSGRCIHREENSKEWGVDPDVTIEMTPEQMRAAIKARQEQDILRDIEAAPAEGKHEQLKETAPAVAEKVADAREAEADRKNKDPLACDPQLSAALLMLRLQLAGAQL